MKEALIYLGCGILLLRILDQTFEAKLLSHCLVLGGLLHLTLSYVLLPVNLDNQTFWKLTLSRSTTSLFT
jgi:hypothetical protein